MKPAANVLSQKVADEAVLLDLEKQAYFGLDPVATVIWEALSEESSGEGVVDRIVEAFDVEREVARRDLEAFLSQLQEYNLITPD